MPQEAKRAWSRPEPIVIVRRGQEENAVLEFCAGGLSGGPGQEANACAVIAANCTPCGRATRAN